MTTSRKPARPARRPRYGTLEQALGTPLTLARNRIATCERFGLEPSPEDVALVAEADGSK